MHLGIKILIAAIAGAALGLVLGEARAQETTAARSVFDQPPGSLQESLPSSKFDQGSHDNYAPTSESGYVDVGTPCSVGRSAVKKLGKRSWELGSLTTTSSNKVRVDLYRTTQHKTAQASSISFETACVIMKADFHTPKKVRVRGGKLVAAH